MVYIHFGDLSGDGVDLIFIFHAIQDKFHLIIAVIQVIFLLYELQIRAVQLSGKDALGSFGIDIPLAAISVVIIIIVQSNGLGADVLLLYHAADLPGELLQKIIGGISRAPLHLEDDVPGVAVDGGVEVARLVDGAHQLMDHCAAGLPGIVPGCVQDLAAILVQGIETDHIAVLVIFHFDFGIDA